MDTNHAGDHNAVSNALTDIINELGSNPSGAVATVDQRFQTIEAADWVDQARIANNAVGYNELAALSVDHTKFVATQRPLIICTSSTRPAGSIAGQLIFETDKSRVRVFDGTNWLLVSGLMGGNWSGTGTSIANGGNANLSADTETLDTDAMSAVGSATVTVPEAGTWAVALDLSCTSGTPSAGLGTLAKITAGGTVYEMAVTSITESFAVTVPIAAAGTIVCNVLNATGGTCVYSHAVAVRRVSA
jgi:hypothetical protein